jgi:tetratricopeptide (TPR) repeat protein
MLRITKILFISAGLMIICDLTFSQTSDINQEIRNLIQNERYDQAKSLLETAIKKRPADADLHYLLGVANLRLLDHVSLFKKLTLAEQGSESLAEAIRLDPNHMKAYKELSEYYYFAPRIAGGNKEKSLQLIEKLKTTHAFHYFIYKGDYFVQSDNIGEALANYGQAHATYPDSLLPILKLGYYSRETKQYDTALEYYRKALEVDSTKHITYYHLGQTYLESGESVESAIYNFEKFIDHSLITDSLFVEHAYYRIGTIYELNDECNVAMQAYNRAITFNKSYAPAIKAIKNLSSGCK